MLCWKRYSGVSVDCLLALIFADPGADPLATANGSAAPDDVITEVFPVRPEKIKY